jgi:hypothetical protein
LEKATGMRPEIAFRWQQANGTPPSPRGFAQSWKARAFNSCGTTLSKYGQISGVAQSQGARNLSARAIFRDIEFAAPQNADCALSSRHKAHSLSHSRGALSSRHRLVFKRGGALFSGEISVKLSCPENIECNISTKSSCAHGERRPGWL